MRTTQIRPVRRAARLAVTCGVVLSIVACGGDDDSASEPQVIEVTATDFAFDGIPDTVPAGTRFTLVNEAPMELHEIVAIRIPDDEQRSVADLLQLPPDELMAIFAAVDPATVILAAPGDDQIDAVGDGTLSEPGRYALICFIPTGVSPQAYLEAAAAAEGGPPEIEGGPPHFVHGMHAEVTVE